MKFSTIGRRLRWLARAIGPGLGRGATHLQAAPTSPGRYHVARSDRRPHCRLLSLLEGDRIVGIVTQTDLISALARHSLRRELVAQG